MDAVSAKFPPLDLRPNRLRYDDPPPGCEVLIPECDVVLLCQTASEFFVFINLPEGERDITPQLSSFVAFGLANMRAAVGGDGFSVSGDYQEEVGQVRMADSHPEDRFWLVDLQANISVQLTPLQLVRAVSSACSTLLQRPASDSDQSATAADTDG